jgi:F0F1-type ATP synthase membrane subunit c/vacuolar-type H+-ATPase subunit K
MMEAQDKDAIDKGMQTLWVIWAAMLGSLGIYIFVCFQLVEGVLGNERTEVPINLLRKILLGVVAAELIMSYYLRQFMLKDRSSNAGVNSARRSSTLNQPPLVSHYTVAVIISLALADSIGVYGLVLFLLGDSLQVFYTFIGISALAMVFYRPRREELERLALAYKQGDEEGH